MSAEEVYRAVPGGQESTLLMVSLGFLTVVFTIIGGFVAKLWYDERRARHNREAAAELLEPTGRRGGANRERVPAFLAEEPGNFQPGRNNDDESEYDSDGEPVEARDANGKKIGKKKLAKLQAKQEARAEREAMLADREEKKKREEKERKDRELAAEAEAERERQEAEAEKRRLEEKARKEHEEYLKMKEAFSVEEEGYDQVEEEEAENLMAAFVEHIKTNKVVNLDDLGSMFKLSVEDVASRIQHFIVEGQLTGVIDDRGKFIYVTPEELRAVAKFVQQRGRISLSDLVDYSNRLISLEPVAKEEPEAESI